MATASTNPLTVRESRFRRMVYSHAAGVVIAEFERDGPPRTTRSLYVRDARTFEYERLATDDDRTSYDCPVVARSVPYLFFNVTAIGDAGGHWLHVARANILTREIEIVFTEDHLLALAKCDPTWPIRPWVSALLDVTDDGSMLTCTVGLPEPRANGAFHMNYGIFDLDLARHTLTHLADFKGTPFW